MKKFILILLTLPLFAICGCNNQPQPQPQLAPERKIQIEIKPAPAPVQPALPPHVISPMYMSGYWDGYFGRYVSWRWAYFDYREGWNLGKFDRQHGIKRFPHP